MISQLKNYLYKSPASGIEIQSMYTAVQIDLGQAVLRMEKNLSQLQHILRNVNLNSAQLERLCTVAAEVSASTGVLIQQVNTLRRLRQFNLTTS